MTLPNALSTTKVLICVVPTVLILVSAYWLRRRKKYKNNMQSSLKVEPSSEITDNAKAATFNDCTSEGADTLSDASSLASPNSSEKSPRTKTSSPRVQSGESGGISANKNPALDKTVPRYKDPQSSSCQLEPYSPTAKTISNIDQNNYSAESIDANSVILNTSSSSEVSAIKPVVFNSQLGLGKSNCEIDLNNHYESSESSENLTPLETSDLVAKDPIQLEAAEMILKMMNYNNKQNAVVANGVSPSNDSMISSPSGELEKLGAVETESNDSHSSVLDENSLSYVSDDSEGRQLLESKIKNGPSNAIDEDGIYDISEEKSSNVETRSILSPVDIDLKTSDNNPELLVNRWNVIQEQDSGCEDSTSVSTPSDPQLLTCNGNDCSNSLDDPVHTQLVEKLSICEDNSEKDSSKTLNDTVVSTHSSKALAPCDRSTTSDATPAELPGSILPAEDSSDGVDGAVGITAVVPSANSNGSSGAAAEPQIPAMNITQRLSIQSSLASQNSEVSSTWEVDNCEVSNQSKQEEIIATGAKVPDTSTSPYVYEFELPQELCGHLIGRNGKHVKSVKDRSHANVYIKRHPYDPHMKIVVVEGSRTEVNDALEIIRRKYPPSRFPTVSLVKTNLTSSNVLPESLQLHLPEGTSCDVILSSLVSAGHFFLQQPTHPTYPSLSTLDQCMINCYSQLDTPLLPHPVEAGVICAAPVLRGWYRAQVIYVYENEFECDLKFVDYGGFSQAATSSLRQIRSDFMSLPFQASECYLANVRPIDPAEGWSAEATATFEELAQGQILQALVVEYAPDGIPCVQLYRVQGISNMFINKELVERGYAVWVNNSHWDPH